MNTHVNTASRRQGLLREGGWPSLILLYVFGAVATSLVSQAVPIVSDLAREFSLSHTLSGWVISLPSLITAIFALIGGVVIDKVGDKKVLIVGAIAALVGNLGVCSAHSLAALLLSRLLEGVGYLSLTVGAVTLMMRTTQGSRRNKAMGLWTSHTAVGIGLTLSLVAPLAGHGERWRWAFGGHAVLSAVLLIAAFFLPAPNGVVRGRRLEDIREVLKRPLPYRIAFASCASAFIQTGVMAALTVYLAKTFAISIPRAAGVGTVAEVFVVVGCLSVGSLLSAGVRERTLACVGGAISLLGGLTLYAPANSLLVAAAGVCAFSIGIGCVNGLIWTFVPKVSPSVEAMGATSGLVAQATYLGVLLGPPAIFASFYPDGWTLRLGLVVLATALQLLLLPVWSRRSALATSDLASSANELHHG